MSEENNEMNEMNEAQKKLADKRTKVAAEKSAPPGAQSFEAAFLAMQQELPTIPKTKTGFNFVYAPYETIAKHAFPVMWRHGFAIRHHSEVVDAATAKVVTLLIHVASGGVARSEKCYDPKAGDQNQGKSLTYAKRYNTVLLLGLSIEGEPDTDDTIPADAKPKAQDAPARSDDF